MAGPHVLREEWHEGDILRGHVTSPKATYTLLYVLKIQAQLGVVQFTRKIAFVWTNETRTDRSYTLAASVFSKNQSRRQSRRPLPAILVVSEQSLTRLDLRVLRSIYKKR